MTRLTLAGLALVVLMGCESPTAVIPPAYAESPGAMEGQQCAKYRLWPSTVDLVGQHALCMDGGPSEVVAARWTPRQYGVCSRDVTGSEIRGGLQAVEYVYGCPKARQVAPPKSECVDCEPAEVFPDVGL